MLLLVLPLLSICAYFLVSWAYHFYKIPPSSNKTIDLAFKLLQQYPLRISVTASTGSGKSTLCKQLSEMLEIPHVELDAHYHGPNWTPRPPEVFKESVFKAVGMDTQTEKLLDDNTTWIVDGNYSALRDPVWQHANVIIWLDYHSHVVYPRLGRRILRRGIYKEVLWNGNTESLWKHFFTKDSLFLWLWKTHTDRQKKYRVLFKTPEYKNRVIHLESPEQTRKLLSMLKRSIEKSN